MDFAIDEPKDLHFFVLHFGLNVDLLHNDVSCCVGNWAVMTLNCQQHFVFGLTQKMTRCWACVCLKLGTKCAGPSNSYQTCCLCHLMFYIYEQQTEGNRPYNKNEHKIVSIRSAFQSRKKEDGKT
jgi:hypothetical protein